MHHRRMLMQGDDDWKLRMTSLKQLPDEQAPSETISLRQSPLQLSQLPKNNSKLEAADGDNDDYDDEDENDNCIQPSIEDFPRPLMGQATRSHGGVIVHIAVAIYMFVGLAIVCEDYFVPSLGRISDVLGIRPDVAGATLMAAGSSVPEIATTFIGVVITENDIGISGVVGSSIFNITLVVGICALFAPPRHQSLKWWPVFRDCFSYLASIVMLLFSIADQKIYWYESLIFVLCYVLYCLANAYDAQIEAAISPHLPVPHSWRAMPGNGASCNGSSSNGSTGNHPNYKSMEINDTNNHHNGEGGGARGGIENGHVESVNESNLANGSDHHQPMLASVYEDHLKIPDGSLARIVWFMLYPVYFISMLTIPDCRREGWANYYALAFVMSILWLSFYSYMMVWMITIIGFTLRVPDTVMGLTFVAAGVSSPDVLLGVAAVKAGQPDMAVSNSLGSNVCDILLCLGLPWLIFTTMVHPGGFVVIISKGMVYSSISLFATIFLFVIVLHFNKWQLNRTFGAILLVWYIIFMIISSLYECNFFGYFNPPSCPSNY